MSNNFWAQRLGGQQPAAPPQQPAQAPASNRPWWMPQAVAQPVQQQPQQPPALVPQHSQPVSVTEDGKVALSDLLQQTEYTTEKAQSARDSETCPSCGSPNYVADKSNSRSMKHCFDCGSNPRFEQSMAGISGIGQNVPVHASRVQNAPVPGAPKMGSVIGHI